MKIKTWQYIVIGVLAIGAVGLIAVNAWLTPYDLKTEQAAARAAGLPLSNAELVRPKPPANQDAAPDWLALADLLKMRDIDDSLVTNHNDPLSSAAIADIHRLLRERQDAMSLIHRATDKPEAFFEHTWTPSELFPYFAHMRQAAKMLRWEALMLYRQGRVEDAIAAQTRGFRIADHAATDPMIISHLVSIAVEAITLAGFEDMLLEAGPDPRFSAEVRRALASNPCRRNLTETLRAESLFGVNGIREIRTLKDARDLFGATLEEQSPPPKSGRSNPLVVHYVARQGEAAYLKWNTRMYEAGRLPSYIARMAARREVARELDSKRLKPPGEMVAAMVVPVFAKVEERDMAALANRRVLLAACYVLDHRARTGSWPARIEDASAKPPFDPFTGRPMGYRREGRGFVLYSVGPEGTFAAKPGQPDRGQAVFRYPRTTSSPPAAYP